MHDANPTRVYDEGCLKVHLCRTYLSGDPILQGNSFFFQSNINQFGAFNMLLKKNLVVAGLALVQGGLATLQIVRLPGITYESRKNFAYEFRSLLQHGPHLVQTNTSRLMVAVCIDRIVLFAHEIPELISSP